MVRRSVLILQCGSRPGPWTCRSLAAAGHDVVAAHDGRSGGATGVSRGARRPLRSPSPEDDPGGYAAWLERTVAHHPPPAVAGRRLKIKYMTQVKTRPPGFVLSCTRPKEVPQSYVRYLVNGLRETFDIPGVPVRISIHASENPYASRAPKRK